MAAAWFELCGYAVAGSQPAPYAIDDIDSFFVIDGDLNYFLIPIEVVGGLTGIHLAAYAPYRLHREIAYTVESMPCLS